MKLHYLLFVIILFFCFPAKAENRVYERVYVHTDKDCYIAGEDIRLKIYVIDSHFQPSDLSKVGYVEICNTEKPLLQIKVALENGGGSGKIEIPTDIPSGIYQLSGYTRYMRNEGEKVFFQKQIAIVNAEQQTIELQRFELIEKPEPAYSTKPEAANVLIKTSQSEYGNREKVVLSIDHIPANTADLVISVSRNDTIAETPEINNQEWLKQVNATLPFSQQWTPEYEGHIITGRLAPEPQEKLSASVAFAGNDVHYFGGQINTQTNTVNFYTADLFGPQQIVTSAISPGYYDKVPYRIDLLSPFSESLPASLPVLPIYRDEGQLMERYLGVQMQKKIDSKTIDNFTQTPNDRTFQPVLSYDLDEYTRFNTISETILEFINKVSVIRMQDKRKISVYIDEEQRSSQRTLVLLDGIPVYDHQDILNYNPMYIKRINIYNECFTFGGNDFDGIVSFLTREGNLPFFQLSNESQLFNYDCPQLPSLFDAPDYSTQPAKNSRKPDFRHTLYWNPFVQFTTGQPVHQSFYTSDLCGLFKVTVEGITTDGEMVQGSINFQVATLSK